MGEQHDSDGVLLSGDDKAGSVGISPSDFPFPHQLRSQISQGMAGLGHSNTFFYPMSNISSGRERQVNASLHSRHNKVQNTTQGLLESRRREGIRKADTKEAPILL